MSGASACVIGGPTASLKTVLATVADAMPELLADGGAVRFEEYLDVLRVMARHEQDVLLVRVPSIHLGKRDEVALQLREVQVALADLSDAAAVDPGADGFVFMALAGQPTLTVGLREQLLTPVDVSAVPGNAGTFPKVGTVSGDELRAVAQRAQAQDGTGRVTVRIKGSTFEFGAVSGSSPARVKVTDANRLAPLDDAFSLGAERLVGLAPRLGEGDLEVRFTTVHDGAFVALAPEGGYIEAQLHLTPVAG